MANLEGFQCRTCGKWHQGMPLDVGYDAPYYWSKGLQDVEGCFLSPDLCIIKKTDYFVRGLIEIPVIGTDNFFHWGVWTSLSKKNFDRMVELWNDPRLLADPPYFGWLSNSIPGYPETLNLKTNVRSTSLKRRPYVVLEATDHPLSIEQRHGITIDRVREITERSLHCG